MRRIRGVVPLVLALATILAPPAGRADGVPAAKRCVGNPPRQTEDPLSPLCVPYFVGDNGGATSRGVTGDEIRVVVTFDSGSYADETSPQPGIYDVDVQHPPCRKNDPIEMQQPCDHIMVRTVRAWGNYFNDRFQTYGRRVHFFVRFTSAYDPKSRRIDAAKDLDEVGPFAALDQAVFNGFNADYVDGLAARRVMVFGSPVPLPDTLYARRDPYAWEFWTEAQARADLYAGYVCDAVAAHPVAHTADVSMVGKPRRFGLLYPDGGEGAREFVADVKQGLQERCGLSWSAEATFPGDGFALDGQDRSLRAAVAVSAFRAAGVTTVLWLGGVDTRFTHVAAATRYFPEIVFAGDGELEALAVGRLQNPAVWRNAWGMTARIRADHSAGTPEYKAYLDGDPNAGKDDVLMGMVSYRDYFLLFSAIQQAGPNLTPANVAKGLRAMPEVDATGPYRPACFFGALTHSCVKDAMELWWDPGGFVGSSTAPGCFRVAHQGARFRDWDAHADDVFTTTADPCLAFGGTYKIRFA